MPDFSEVAEGTATTRLSRSRVEVANPPHTEIFARRIREANPDQRFTGYFEYSSQPDLFEGIPFAAQFAVAKWFNEMFQARFGEPMKARASHAYDIVKVIIEAQGEETRKLSGPELMARLGRVANVAGASGELNVTEQGTIESPCVFMTVKDGKFAEISAEELKTMKW